MPRTRRIKGDVIVRAIPLEVRNRFKAKCAKEGISMTKAIIAYMRRAANGTAEIYKPQKQLSFAGDDE